MNTDMKKVRVTRTSTIERVEVVEIDITRQKGDYKSHARIAEELIKAGVAAGQPINWTVLSEEIKSYPAPDIDAEDGTAECVMAPPPVAPMSEVA